MLRQPTKKASVIWRLCFLAPVFLRIFQCEAQRIRQKLWFSYVHSFQCSIFRKPYLWGCWDINKGGDFVGYFPLLGSGNSWWFPGREAGRGPFWWRAGLSSRLDHLKITQREMGLRIMKQGVYWLPTMLQLQLWSCHSWIKATHQLWCLPPRRRWCLQWRFHWSVTRKCLSVFSSAGPSLCLCSQNPWWGYDTDEKSHNETLRFAGIKNTSSNAELWMKPEFTHPSTGLQDTFSPSPRCRQTTPRRCQDCSPVTGHVERIISTCAQHVFIYK